MDGINKTVQAVFDKAIYLIDAQSESTGATRTSDTKEYEVRTIGILNHLLDEVYPASDTYVQAGDGTRPALPDVTAFTDELDLDARVLRNVLPLGLAANLLLEENAEIANFFQQRYEENLALAMTKKPADDGAVENVYGGIEYGQFSQW